jgi:ABC-type antimicrobial peptide transport system permease subunit
MSNVVDGYNAVYRNFVNGGSSAGYDPNLFYNPPTSFVISQLITEQTTFLFEEVLVGFFLLTIFVLSLYMVSMLSNVLVERQVATIATLRSRGATHRHIFRAFALQCLVVSVLAVGIAPFCAQLVVMVIAHFLLSATDQSAINVVVRNPVGSALSVGWVALIAGLVAVIVMVLAVRRASKIDILTLRRESARTHKKPFWQRLYLDVTLAAIFVSLFSYYYFVVHTFSDTSRILGPLVLLFAPLLLLSILLLFLRLLPFLLRVGAAITARGNGPAGLLSFAQMARQPQTTLRVILLLATVIAFSIYQLSFIATQRYNNQARMEYQVGADFSGSITVKNYHSLQDSEKMYVAMSGVAAATLGYSTSINTSVSDFAGAVTINAVDTNTYAQTAVWSSAYASQPLSSLTSQLAAHRADALNHNVVYAVVNKAIWQDLGLSPGAIFTLPTSDNHFQHIRFVALAYVNFLPTNQNDSLTMLIDYQSYAAAYAKANAGATLQPNYIWLRAHDDANSRAQIQHAFPTLQNLQQLLNQAQTDPSQVAITGTLALGITVLLVLATIGLVLTAWLSVKRRLTSFAILRALGMSSRQVAAILLWEQGTTYLLALLLGVGIGWVLTTFVEPAFQLMDGLVHISISYNVPRMVVLPYSWFGLLVGLFVLVCAILLFFMGRYAAQPAINHMLRLNED